MSTDAPRFFRIYSRCWRRWAFCAHLAAHPAQTFTKEQIYEAVFGFDGTADSSAITEHIKNIRAKLRAVGLSPIQTVWGVGYKWESA